MKLKPGSGEAFRKLLEEMSNGAELRGWVSTNIYRADSDPNEVWMAVAFESRDAYHKNAQSPEQDARYQQMRALLAADPEWHDGEIVSSVTR